MSLIERALERRKQEERARREGTVTANATKPGMANAVQQATAERSDVSTPTSVPLSALEPAAVLRTRGDRVVNIDLHCLRAAGALAPDSEERRLAEEYRIIKRPLLKTMAQGQSGDVRNLVAITSALPGEGKTFTSINLALSLAMERGREVVLVDGDSAKRHLTEILSLGSEPGLLDVGGQDIEIDQVLLRTDIPSLYILPAGTPHAEATEILRSERTLEVLRTLAADPRRIVLIDSAPMLVTSDAGVLASVAGQVVLVVKASDTPQEVVMRAVEAVADDKPVSLILNQVLSAPERHYGYYYGGYGYGHPAYGSETEATAEQAKSL